MSTEKFALHPGYVTSQKGDERHYIGVGKLIRLYELAPHEYIVWSKNQRGRNWDDYIHLYPRYDGKYGRPDED